MNPTPLPSRERSASTYYHVKLQAYSIQMLAKVKTGGRVTTKEDIILFNKLQLSGEGLTVMLSGHGLTT